MRCKNMPCGLEEVYVPWVENCARLDLELVRLRATIWSHVGTLASEMSLYGMIL